MLGPMDALVRTAADWAEWMRQQGEPVWRGAQVHRWIHRRGVLDPGAMTDLPRALRERLTEELGRMPVADVVQQSRDGTRKLRVRLADGRATETVLIPQAHEGSGVRGGVTQCVSSQVGCAIGCAFCASGLAGLSRHLTAAEIVAQVHLGRAHLEEGERLRTVVFIGMGEPLHNEQAVFEAIERLTDPDGLGLSARRITVSTSGLPAGIERLGRRFGGKVGLALSLHAADDATRDRLVPVNRRFPLADLREALRGYPLPPHRRITLEYTLLRGVNDSLAAAERLARFCRGLRVKVNLIPMNPVEGVMLQPPEEHTVRAFHRRLRDLGVDAFTRKRRGADIDAACGQLALGRVQRPRRGHPALAFAGGDR